jgi:hypothetical protein
MHKEEWKAFLVWLETASDDELESRFVAVSTLWQTLREENAQAEAKRIQREIRMELSARREAK